MKSVLVHGLGQTSASWDKTIQKINKGTEIFCPDLLALVGKKEAVYSNLYKGFVGYCGKLKSPFQLCGLSLGGILALHYSIDHPEKVQSLVLIGTQFKMPKNLLAFQNIIFKFMPQKAFSQMGFGKKEFISLSNSMAELDFSEGLKKVGCPVLVVCGGKDHPNRKASETLAGQLPNARLHIIENAGHEVNIDAPEQLSGLLNEFWRDAK